MYGCHLEGQLQPAQGGGGPVAVSLVWLLDAHDGQGQDEQDSPLDRHRYLRI